MTAVDWSKIVKIDELNRISPEDIHRTDQQWVNLWDDHWNAVEDHWRSKLLLDEPETVIESLRALLNLLRQIVPTVIIKNGTETVVQHAHPNDVSTHIRGAAKILFMGELECEVERDEFLPPPDTAWQTTSGQLLRKMQEFIASEEVTTGDEGMSRRAHAEEAIRALKSVELARSSLRIREDEEIDTGSDDIALSQLSAELAHFAFSAGVHAQLALGKEMERWAVVGQSEAPIVAKRLAGAKAGGRMNAEMAKTQRAHLMEAMLKQIENGKNVSDAARIVQKKFKLQKSLGALRKMWINHQKEFRASIR